MDFIQSKGTVLYSADGRNWTQLGGQFNIAYDWVTGTFQGEQFALFCYNPQPGAGYLDVIGSDSSRRLHQRHRRKPGFQHDTVFCKQPRLHEYHPNSHRPDAWQNVSTNIADANGFWQFTDTNAT